MTQQDQRFVFFHRVASYPLVHYLSDSVKSTYTFAKQSNSLVKKGLETAEFISQPIISKLDDISNAPVINHIIYNVDTFSCKQLDKVENTSAAIKDTTVNTVEKVADKIHGTSVEYLLIKTVDVVDNIVDSLLPPKEDEDISPQVLHDPNLVERTTPVIKKLTTRVSKDSIKNLPSQTYHEVKDLVFRNAEAIPQVQYCIGLLSTASHKVLEAKESTQLAAKQGIQRGAEFSRASADHVYQSLNHLMTVMASLIAGVSRVSLDDAQTALNEVYVLIQESKKKVKVNPNTFKEDISRILQKAGDVLSQQVAAGYDRASHSDYASIRRAASALDHVINKLLESFPAYEPAARVEQ